MTSNVNIYEMEIYMEDTIYIESGAFNSATFSQTECLTLTNLNVSNLSKNTFYGFHNLRTLKLYQLQNILIPTGLLSGVSSTLENLVVFGDFLNAYNLSGMTNGANMSRLELVTYSLNLKNSIDEYSFNGLVAVHTLELSSCDIEVIGPRSFDPMASTLKLLKLNNNRIKHLPDGLFDLLLLGPVKIYLSQNPFDCSCSLSGFQLQIQIHRQNFLEIPKCASPYFLYNVDIDSANMCVNGVDPMLSNLFIKCYDRWNDFIYKPIEKQEHKFRFVQNINQSFTLQNLGSHNNPFAVIVNSTFQSFVPDCIACFKLEIIAGKWIILDQWKLHMLCIVDDTDVS